MASTALTLSANPWDPSDDERKRIAQLYEENKDKPHCTQSEGNTLTKEERETLILDLATTSFETVLAKVLADPTNSDWGYSHWLAKAAVSSESIAIHIDDEKGISVQKGTLTRDCKRLCKEGFLIPVRFGYIKGVPKSLIDETEALIASANERKDRFLNETLGLGQDLFGHKAVDLSYRGRVSLSVTALRTLLERAYPERAAKAFHND